MSNTRLINRIKQFIGKFNQKNQQELNTNAKFSERQMEETQKDLEQGLDVSIYANPEFNRYQIEEGQLLRRARDLFNVHPDVSLSIDHQTIVACIPVPFDIKQYPDLKGILNSNGELEVFIPICDINLNKIELNGNEIQQQIEARVNKEVERITQEKAKQVLAKDILETIEEVQIMNMLEHPPMFVTAENEDIDDRDIVD